VRGIQKNTFFVTHQHKENDGGDDTASKYNTYEVRTFEIVEIESFNLRLGRWQWFPISSSTYWGLDVPLIDLYERCSLFWFIGKGVIQRKEISSCCVRTSASWRDFAMLFETKWQLS
jgi:hypothetical protein